MILRPTILKADWMAVDDAAFAQSSDHPWYLGLGRELTHGANVFRSATGAISDPISTPTLSGSLNVPFVPPRACASVSLSHQRNQDLSARNDIGCAVVGDGLELTGKIVLSGSMVYARRNLVDRFTRATRQHNTPSLSIGANWATTRTVSLGRTISRDSRSALGAGPTRSDSDRYSRAGQVSLDCGP